MKNLTLAAAALTLAVGAASTISAPPATATPVSAAISNSAGQSNAVAFSDADVIGLFIGQGRIIERNPDLARYVPSNSDNLTSAQLRALVAEYKQADPSFHENVTVPLQSGDPYQTLDALDAFRTATASLSADQDVTNVGDGKCALLLAVAVAAALWLGVLVWVALDGDEGFTNEQFAAEVAATFND